MVGIFSENFNKIGKEFEQFVEKKKKKKRDY